MSKAESDADNAPQRDPNEQFRRDLRQSVGSRIEIPGDVDDAVIAFGRLRLGRIRRRRILIRVSAAAAAIAFASVLSFAPGGRDGRAPASVSIDAATGPDVDRSGRVDIVDALLLARAVEAGRAPSALDLDRDGDVDQGDVDRVAALAVQLR